MSWRPKDWSVDKVVIKCVREHGLPKLSIGDHYQSLVEAGADAMLNALEEKGIRGTIDYNPYGDGRRFIPTTPGKDCDDFVFDAKYIEEGKHEYILVFISKDNTR